MIPTIKASPQTLRDSTKAAREPTWLSRRPASGRFRLTVVALCCQALLGCVQNRQGPVGSSAPDSDLIYATRISNDYLEEVRNRLSALASDEERRRYVNTEVKPRMEKMRADWESAFQSEVRRGTLAAKQASPEYQREMTRLKSIGPSLSVALEKYATK